MNCLSICTKLVSLHNCWMKQNWIKIIPYSHTTFCHSSPAFTYFQFVSLSFYICFDITRIFLSFYSFKLCTVREFLLKLCIEDEVSKNFLSQTNTRNNDDKTPTFALEQRFSEKCGCCWSSLKMKKISLDIESIWISQIGLEISIMPKKLMPHTPLLCSVRNIINLNFFNCKIETSRIRICIRRWE